MEIGKFKVGDLVRYANHPVMSGFGIVTRGDYIGNWCEPVSKLLRRQQGGIHVDVLVAGKEVHCLAEWLEKVNE